MSSPQHIDKQPDTGTRVWAAFCYCILIYFTVLVLPFTILRYIFRAVGFILNLPSAIMAPESGLARSHSASNVPGLEHDTPGTATPRNSYDWDADALDSIDRHLAASPKIMSRLAAKANSKSMRPTTTLDSRRKDMGFLVGRKSRENSFIAEYDPCRLWDDDDGYQRCMPITRNTRLYERIIEIE